MFKKNRATLIITSIVTLLPIVAGLLLWNRLPDRMTTHWGADGAADGTGSKAMVVFLVPCVMLAWQWLCTLAANFLPGSKEQNKKVNDMVLWIVPILSVAISSSMYLIALDVESRISIIAIIFITMALMFMVIGNYMPKVKRNSIIGIKIKWTLESDEVWNRTHRLAGKLWVADGLLLLVCIFLPQRIQLTASLVIMLTMIIVPMVYSGVLYHKLKKNGKIVESMTEAEKKSYAVGAKISAVAVPLLLIGIGIVMFTGDVNVTFGEESVSINATYWNDIEIDYEAIDTVTLQKDIDVGTRVGGFASARLMLGTFENEYCKGRYTLYGYTGADYFVIVYLENGETLLISGRTPIETQRIGEELMDRCGIPDVLY